MPRAPVMGVIGIGKEGVGHIAGVVEEREAAPSQHAKRDSKDLSTPSKPNGRTTCTTMLVVQIHSAFAYGNTDTMLVCNNSILDTVATIAKD